MDQLAREISCTASVLRLPLTNTYRRLSRPFGAVLDVRQRRRVRKFIDQSDADLVHVNQQVAEDGLDLLLAAHDSGKPIVSTIHITHSAAGLGARLGWLRDSLAGFVLSALQPRIICVSDAAASTMRERSKLSTLDISAIHPAVPSVDAHALRTARKNARQDWGVLDEDVVVGAVGRIEPQKNPTLLFDAFSGAAEALPNLKFVWIGDGSFRSTIEMRARKKGLVDRVIVEGWRDDARFRMAGLDIFAMPSRFEGLPLALLEAMHAGLAICASDADGIVEAIAHGRDGLILSTSAKSVWSNAFCSLARNEALRRSLGEAAREKASESYSVSRMARETLNLYQRSITC